MNRIKNVWHKTGGLSWQRYVAPTTGALALWGVSFIWDDAVFLKDSLVYREMTQSWQAFVLELALFLALMLDIRFYPFVTYAVNQATLHALRHAGRTPRPKTTPQPAQTRVRVDATTKLKTTWSGAPVWEEDGFGNMKVDPMTGAPIPKVETSVTAHAYTQQPGRKVAVGFLGAPMLMGIFAVFTAVFAFITGWFVIDVDSDYSREAVKARMQER